MSLTFEEVEDSEIIRKAALHDVERFVRVNVNPNIRDQFPFPSDYNFASCFLPERIKEVGDRIFNFEVRPDDVFILGFPKSGTTWLSNIVWQLQNNLTFSSELLTENHMLLELYIWNSKHCEGILENIESAKSPRLIKTLLPAHLLPRSVWTIKPKMIYIYRNTKDASLSNFHYYQNLEIMKYRGSMEDFFDVFMNDHIPYAPYLDHVKGFRKLSDLDHVMLVSYNELIVNPFREIKKISEFLGYAYTEDQLKQLVQHVSFKNMRENFKNPFRNSFSNNFSFYRKGKSGGYVDEMSAGYIQKFDEWEKTNSD